MFIFFSFFLKLRDYSAMNIVSVYLIHLSSSLQGNALLGPRHVYILQQQPMNVLSYFLNNISIHQWCPVYRGISSTAKIYFLSCISLSSTDNQPTDRPTKKHRHKTLVQNVILFFLCFLCLNSFDFCVFTYLSYPIQGNPQH